jgi:hypothetical protein
MQLTRYVLIAVALAGCLTAQTVQVSITLKPEWHASFEKGIANLNQQRARSGQPSQTQAEFLHEAMSKVIFSIVDNLNEPVDKPAEIRQADTVVANAQLARQNLSAMMVVAAEPVTPAADPITAPQPETPPADPGPTP